MQMSGTGDVLRAEGLQGPYYGLQPPRNSTVPVDDLRKELVSISALVNTGVPVNKLPNEILLAIFHFGQETTDEAAAPEWTTFLLVCRRWFVIAATTPHLWRELVVGKSLNLLRTGLVRSKGLTIGVSVIKRDAVPETAKTIVPHLHRLHSLSFRSIYQLHKSHVEELMRYPMPILERLEAMVEEPVMYMTNQRENPSLGIEDMPLPIDRFPKLRSLTVEKIDVPPAPDAVYRQLTVLHLWGLESDDFDVVVNILRLCENVEDLGLYLGMGALDFNMEEKVVVPKLRTLELRGWRFFLCDILKAITIPATVDLSIHLSGPRSDRGTLEESIAAVLPPNHETEVPIFASVTEVHAQAGEDEDVVVAYAPTACSQSATERRRLSLRMPVIHRKRGERGDTWDEEDEKPAQEDENPRELARSLRRLDVFSVSPVETLHVDIQDVKVKCVNWSAVFGHFPLLRELSITVKGQPQVPSGVLSALAPPATDSEAAEGQEPGADGSGVAVSVAPFPRLRVLRLHRFASTSNPEDYDGWVDEGPFSYNPHDEMDLVAEVSGLFSRRRDAACDALEKLVLDLDCLERLEWAKVDERRDACKSALETIVGRLEYEERHSWRAVFEYKDGGSYYLLESSAD